MGLTLTELEAQYGNDMVLAIGAPTANYSMSLNIAKCNSSTLIIDFGDGSTLYQHDKTTDIVTDASGVGLTVTHTYTNIGTYQLKIKILDNVGMGLWEIASSSGSVVGIISWGKLKVKAFNIYNTDNLVGELPLMFPDSLGGCTDISLSGKFTIPDAMFSGVAFASVFTNLTITNQTLSVLPNISSLTNLKKFQYYYGYNIKSISSTYFQNCLNILEINFYYCGLRSLPSGLFANLTKLFSLTIQYCHGLLELPVGLLPNNITLNNVSFNYCKNLKVLPADLFANCPNLYNINNCFSFTAIETIPDNFFANNTKLYYVESTFSYCNFLKTIGTGLFPTTNNVYTVKNCFNQCYNLTTIPSDLLTNCTKLNNVENIFNSCLRLQSIPVGLFNNCTLLTNVRNCFLGCKNLLSIPAGLFKNLTNLIDASGIFSGCYFISSIPEDMFENCIKLQKLNSAFNYLFNVRAIPPNLFKTCIDLREIGNMFYFLPIEILPEGLFSTNTKLNTLTALFSYTKLKSLPASLFNVTNPQTNIVLDNLFGYCFFLESINGTALNFNHNTNYTASIGLIFTNCFRLKNIPADIFSNIKSITIASAAFSNCVSIETIPDTIFSSQNALINVDNLFQMCYKLKVLPENIIKNKVTIQTAEAMFYACYSLNINLVGKESIFKGCTGLKNINSTFSNLGYVQIDNTLFSDLVNITSAKYLFSDSGLLNIPDGLFDNNILLTDIGGAFYNTCQIFSVPVNLLKNLVNLTLVNDLFGRSNIVEIPDTFFDNNTKITSMANMFQYAHSLKKVPSNIFANKAFTGSYYYIFDECIILDQMPDLLPLKISGTMNFSGFMNECYYVKGTVDEIWNWVPTPTYFSKSFYSCDLLTNFDSIPSTYKN